MREIVAFDEEGRHRRLGQLAALRSEGKSIEEVYAARRRAQPDLTGNIYYRIYQAADSYIAVGCLGAELRERFRRAIDLHDPRYDEDSNLTAAEAIALGDALEQQAEAIMRSRPAAEWIALFDARGVPCGPMRFVDELWDDAQVQANGYLEEFEHPLFGTLRQTSPILRMTGTPTRISRPSPTLGQHTDEILGRIGFTGDIITSLRESGVIL
jgi:formyl-CoA transferase